MRPFSFAFVLAGGLLAAASVHAAEPSIRMQGSGAAPGLSDQVQRLASGILGDVSAAANAGPGSGITRYFDLNKSLSEMPGFTSFPAADRILMEGAKRTYDLFRALGVPPTGSFAAVGVDQGRYFLALDGQGGRWVASPAEALSFLAKQLVETQMVLDRPGKSGPVCPFDYQCLLRSLYSGDAPTIAYVPRGTTVVMEMTGDGFASMGGPPVVIAANGLIVNDVTFISSEALSVRLSIPTDAPIGVASLLVFNEGQTFRARERYSIQVVASADDLAALFSTAAGSDSSASSAGGSSALADANGIPGLPGTNSVEILTDDQPNESTSAAELTVQASGRLEAAGDVDVYRISVQTPGALTLSSSGPTDVTAVLVDANGTVIAKDDDSGTRYNFLLQTPVVAGTYFLKVTHCCTGTGTYRLSKSFQSN